MDNRWDVIVVGARCAGAPTAMLLAKLGYRVLLVDRAEFPSDVVSTHLIHPPGIAALARWGLLDSIRDSGAPAVTGYTFDFGDFMIAGQPQPIDGFDRAFAPRRTVLDSILVDAAVQAGAEFRPGYTVDDLITDHAPQPARPAHPRRAPWWPTRVVGLRGRVAGRSNSERATVIVGADGRHSFVARTLGAAVEAEHPPLEATYYAYWSDVPVSGFTGHIRPGRAIGTWPTNDGLTVVTVSWPRSEFESNRGDVEGSYMRSLELVPELAAQLGAAQRASRFAGTGELPGHIRTPFGPGWALVGDAGYHPDPVTAQGIMDAFLDAEALVAALDATFRGDVGFDEAMAEYQAARDRRIRPIFEFTKALAALEPPPPELARLLRVVSTDPTTSREFISAFTGTLPLGEFFSPANTQRILGDPVAPTPHAH
jgi:2-polyprenyl-6-methoxyphenol hydroxylase-like FAD-dependent oxidoreductase